MQPVLACLTVLILAQSTLAMPRTWPSATSAEGVLQLVTQALTSPLQEASGNKHPEDKKAYVLVDYKVPPSHQHDFVSAFEMTSSATKKEEGSIVYTLSRTLDDNLTFYLYAEWEDMKAYGEHFQSTYLKDFLETIAGLDVAWKLHILEPVVY